MIDKYTIYVVNKSANQQLFWAFLSEPVVSDSPKVFANSSTNIAIPAGSTNLNSFKIPVQYIIGSGASNNAIALHTEISSNATRNANLNELWDIEYYTVPPRQGPSMPNEPSGTSSATTIAMGTSTFNQVTNRAHKWYENMSFGVKTERGLIGLTWSPEPSKVYTITPKLVFYIAVGEFSANSLADITAISKKSAECDTNKSFDVMNQCTVTYDETDQWHVAKGKPG